MLLHINARRVLIDSINIGNDNKETFRWRTAQLSNAGSCLLMLQGQLGTSVGNGNLWFIYVGQGTKRIPAAVNGTGCG